MAGGSFLPRLRGSGKGGSRGQAPADPLASCPLFASLAPDVLARVRKKLSTRAIADGKPLFQAGQPADALYVVQSGRLRVVVRNRQRQERVLQFVGPGEVLGEAAFMADVPYATSAEAVEPSKVWQLARADFDELMGKDQGVLRYLAALIAQRQQQANARVAAESSAEDARVERGYVTAFFSPRGGAGVTTLAVAAGIALAERHPDDVVLLDLSVLFGHSASYLWLQPKGVLAHVPPATLSQLDRRGLDYYLLAHESSLRVFPPANRPEEGEQISAEHVRAAVGLLKRHFRHVILDLPHGFSEVALAGLELAQRIYVVGTPELATLRDLVEVRRIFSDLLSVQAEKQRFLLNHPQPYSGIPLADIARTTGVTWEEIAFGGEGPAQAALRGESLPSTRPNNPVSRASAILAEQMDREAAEQAALAGR